MKYLLILSFILMSTLAKSQENPGTYVGVGFGFALVGGLVHASPMFKGNRNDRNAVRYTNTIGVGMGIIGFGFMTYAIVLTNKKYKLEAVSSNDGLGLRLNF